MHRQTPTVTNANYTQASAPFRKKISPDFFNVVNPYDAAGNLVVSHVAERDQNQKAKSIIQSSFRHFFRAKHIHTSEFLFGTHSKNSLKNKFNSDFIPEEFRHLANSNLPSLFNETRHTSTHLTDILHDGILYSKAHIMKKNLSLLSDDLRDDDRMVFTSPKFFYSSSLTSPSMTLNIAELLKHNDPGDLYFKVFDWALDDSITINLTDNITCQFNLALNDCSCEFIYEDSSQPSFLVTIPDEYLVYHGANGLNEYLTFLIFKIIDLIPQEHQETKQHIYTFFKSLSTEELISALNSIAIALSSKCELDFISPVRLNFLSINKIEFDDYSTLNFEKIRHFIQANHKSKLWSEILPLYSHKIKSYFIIKGMHDYAIKCNAHSIQKALEESFSDVLSLAEQSQHLIPNCDIESLDAYKLIYAILNTLSQHSLSTEFDPNITFIINTCNEKYSNQFYYGADALNRKIVLDGDIAPFMTPRTLYTIFFLYLNLKGSQNFINSIYLHRDITGQTTLVDVLLYAFKKGLKVIELLPNNDPEYSVNDYFKQKLSFQLYTKRIIQQLCLLAQKLEIKPENFIVRAKSDPNLINQVSHIKNNIDLIDSAKLTDTLLMVPGYDTNDILNQVKEGFLALCKQLSVIYTESGNDLIFSNQTSLASFVESFLTNDSALLNGDVSHLFYDRVHLEACFVSPISISILHQPQKFTLGDFFEEIALQTSAKARSSIAFEQISVRFQIVLADLKNRFPKLFAECESKIAAAQQSKKRSHDQLKASSLTIFDPTCHANLPSDSDNSANKRQNCL